MQVTGPAHRHHHHHLHLLSHLTSSAPSVQARCGKLGPPQLMNDMLFDAHMNRAVLNAHIKDCGIKLRGSGAPSPLQWITMALPAEEKSYAPGTTRPSLLESAHGKCLLRADSELAIEFTEELEGLYPPKGLKAEYLMNGGKALGCSELMLQPMGALMKSASYAEALEEWVKTFPREQIKVINTDDLERGAQRIMNETFDHIGLPRVDVGTKSRFCVRGKQGVIDILKDEENKVRIGKNETLHEENVKVKIDDCDSDPAATHRDPQTGALHHNVSPKVEARLRKFFAPYNQRLYKFLGRDLGWG